MNSTLVSWVKFNTVGLAGFGVQLAVLALLKSGLGMHYLVATIIAVETAVVHNFIWHERWTWAHRVYGTSGALMRLLRFNAGNGVVSLAGNVFLMWVFVSKFNINYLIANIVSIGVCSIVNFLISDRLVFRVNS
jgi:putative flippase GtrA